MISPYSKNESFYAVWVWWVVYFFFSGVRRKCVLDASRSNTCKALGTDIESWTRVIAEDLLAIPWLWQRYSLGGNGNDVMKKRQAHGPVVWRLPVEVVQRENGYYLSVLSINSNSVYMEEWCASRKSILLSVEFVKRQAQSWGVQGDG